MFNAEAIPTVLKNYSSSTIEPSKKDVLCGKDTTLARHPGNQLFREKIQAELPHYLSARSKQDKMKITKSIVHYITVKQGSRFLKMKGNSEWTEIDSQAARDKVSHALRFAARQKQKTSTDASTDATTATNTVVTEQSDDNSSQGSYTDDSTSSSTSPPPMPSRQEMERNTTNVEELFAAFDQQPPLGFAIDQQQQQQDETASTRRDSAHLMLNFLSSVDFDFDDEEDEELDLMAALPASNSILHEGFSEHAAVTQWAAC